MNETVINIMWAVIFSGVGATLGIFVFVRAASKLPQIFDKLTPNINEGKEIVRGNTAVAEYYGRIVAAGILGLSVIIAAAVIGGIIAGLH